LRRCRRERHQRRSAAIARHQSRSAASGSWSLWYLGGAGLFGSDEPVEIPSQKQCNGQNRKCSRSPECSSCYDPGRSFSAGGPGASGYSVPAATDEGLGSAGEGVWRSPRQSEAHCT
jgi:hypothetical protein